MKHSNRNEQSGFTLTELSIVLVVIALIIGALLTGQTLIRNGKIRAVISEVEKYTAAVNTFEQAYQCLPGDCQNATTVLDSTTYATLANGDGNGHIEDIDVGWTLLEGEQAWFQLYVAKMIEGTFSANSWYQCYLGTAGAYDNMGPSKLDNIGYFFHYFDNTGLGAKDFIGLAMSDQVECAAGNIFTAVYTGGITPELARAIDLKMDDGFSSLGKVNANFATPTYSTCVDAGLSYYDLTKKGNDCSMIFNFSF